MTTTLIGAAARPETPTALLDVRDPRKVYGGGNRSVEAVRNLTFSIAPGEPVCIVGPSGAGKTTLLRCVAGLLDTASGEVVLEEVAVDLPDDRDQLTTRSLPRFAELRAHVYELIQRAKRGDRPAG